MNKIVSEVAAIRTSLSKQEEALSTQSEAAKQDRSRHQRFQEQLDQVSTMLRRLESLMVAGETGSTQRERRVGRRHTSGARGARQWQDVAASSRVRFSASMARGRAQRDVGPL